MSKSDPSHSQAHYHMLLFTRLQGSPGVGICVSLPPAAAPPQVDVVVFDKTGTLTAGRPVVTQASGERLGLVRWGG